MFFITVVLPVSAELEKNKEKIPYCLGSVSLLFIMITNQIVIGKIKQKI